MLFWGFWEGFYQEFYSFFLSVILQPTVEIDAFFDVGEESFEMIGCWGDIGIGKLSKGEYSVHIIFDEAVGKPDTLPCSVAFYSWGDKLSAMFNGQAMELIDEVLRINSCKLAHE